MIALEWSDIDFRGGSIRVQRSDWRGYVTVPKGGRDRRVPMTKRLAALLKANRQLGGGRILRGDREEKFNRAVIWYWMRKAQGRADLKETGGVHILRHTFCSRLAIRGAPAKAIQELAGHANLGTTQRYMHLSPAAKDAAIALLDAEVVCTGDILETGSGSQCKLQ
jgi:integrase